MMHRESDSMTKRASVAAGKVILLDSGRATVLD